MPNLSSSGLSVRSSMSRGTHKNSKTENKSSTKSLLQLSKKEVSASSISKRFMHMTRKIGSGLTSSTSKHLNEKNTATSFKEMRNPADTDSHYQSVSDSHSERVPQSKVYTKHSKGSQRSFRSSFKRLPSASRTFSSSKKSTESFDNHIPNNATASTATSSSVDELSTVLSEEFATSHYTPHSFRAGKHTFIVDSKYSFVRVIGHGAYGVVVSSLDKSIDEKVAIKMIPKAFHDEIDAKRILREIKLLKHLKHENIIGIRDMMPPLARYAEDFHDVYITTDLMETDLHRIIYSKQSLSIDHVQYFVYQILRALKYIHSANVIHRDLKPSNLLVNSNCDLKICDFGLARGIMSDDDMEASRVEGSLLLTEYVVTRWYRAPEIMLSCHEYAKPIDLWSVGCIFAELLARKPYFPGEDYIDQVSFYIDQSKLFPVAFSHKIYLHFYFCYYFFIFAVDNNYREIRKSTR